MAIEVGSILEGKVTGIKAFGAFVTLPEGKTGLVHISEVSNEFIQDLHTVLQEGQTVKVKVISVAPDGKIALSIKQLLPPAPRTGNRPGPAHGNAAPHGGFGGGPRGPKRPPRDAAPRVWEPRRSVTPDSMSFEDMMSRFKSQSEEKMADLDHEQSGRRGGGYAPRGHKK